MYTCLRTRTRWFTASARAHDEVDAAVRLHNAADPVDADCVRGVLARLLHLPRREPAEVAHLGVRGAVRVPLRERTTRAVARVNVTVDRVWHALYYVPLQMDGRQPLSDRKSHRA
jgi:phosphate-selective porin